MTVASASHTQQAEIQRIFKLQQANKMAVGATTAKERIRKLDKLRDAVMKYRPEIREAMWKDYHKPAVEVDLTEIYMVTSEIKHTKAHLKEWMRPQHVPTPIGLAGSSSWIQYESKGTCLIIAPWNYPLNLTFGPLVCCIAAGNTAMIKPSEHSPNSSALMSKIIREVFDESEVAIFEGDVDTSTALLDLPFNHIFFTGAPEIGKIVMRAASKHLTSVTLELGGKSPTIIDETANMDTAVSRIAWGKFSNSGQICLAPDYILVHENKKEAFITAMKKKLESYYGKDPAQSKDFTHVINQHHFKRVKSYLENSLADGAVIAHGGRFDETTNYLEPTLVTDVPLESDLMQKEIFGPVLPIRTYKNIQEVIDFINSKEKPLGLYIYSKSRKNIKQILKYTRAGGTCINHNNLHYANMNLPFGGSNYSGLGKSHGKFGFEAFSDARAVYKQNLPSAIDLLVPPYNNWKLKLVDLTIKWF